MIDPAGHEGDLSYHQRMVADVHRMTTYERAIRAVVRPGDAVLDVGAGTGVLSLFAARAGARVVHAVESMSVGQLIGGLALQNAVADRVVVHQADVRELPIAEPVDVIVSDCLGRFLLDDRMGEAMQAAFRWLKPEGRVIPGSVELVMAPVELVHFLPLDTWRFTALGLDVSPLERFAEHQTYAITCDPYQLLAEPAALTTWRPPEVAPSFDKELDYVVTRAGRLRGLIGWFRATLAPGVVLSTEPGHETHWSQLLFPLPPRRVREGDRLRVTIAPRPEAGGWSWTVVLTPADGAAPETFSMADGGLPVDSVETRWPELVDVDAEHARGMAAWEAGDSQTAAAAFTRAVGAMDPRDPDAPDVWENLGLCWHAERLWSLAIGAFMRALDGDWTSREQSLRLLVDATFRGGRSVEGARWLSIYEARFGPHPAGWACQV